MSKWDKNEILERFDISLESGFLPQFEPLNRLNEHYLPWERIAQNMTECINAGVIQQYILALPQLSIEHLRNRDEEERAFLILCMMAHAFVHFPGNEQHYIPANIAVPLDALGKKFDRLPVLSHPSLVLRNWKLLDVDKPPLLDNIACLLQFHGGLDEAWFYLVTVEIEYYGGAVISAILNLMESVEAKDTRLVSDQLIALEKAVAQLWESLKRIYDKLDPHIFYTRVRHFLASLEEVKFEGCEPEIRSYHGGSAAQSSLIQSIDACLGITYSDKPKAEAYLKGMRMHMTKEHRSFIEWVEENSSVYDYCTSDTDLKEKYDAVVKVLVNFRNEHLEMVARYIIQPAQQLQKSTKGTGGTNPLFFLKDVRNENKKSLS